MDEVYLLKVIEFLLSRDIFSELKDPFLIGCLLLLVVLIAFLINPNLRAKRVLWQSLLILGGGMVIIAGTAVAINRANQQYAEPFVKNTPKHRTLAQQTIAHLYHKKGLAGRIQVQSVSQSQIMFVPQFWDVNYTYTEQIDGQQVKKKLTTTLNPDLTGFYDAPPFSGSKITRADFKPGAAASELGATADKQPAVVEQYRTERKALQAQLPAAFQVKAIAYNLADQTTAKSSQFQELKQQVRANRQQGLPIGGYYNLDLAQLARDGVIDFVVDIAINDEQESDDLEKQENFIKAKVSGLDFNGFWDGNYYFRFAELPKEQLRLTILNGQLQSAKWVADTRPNGME
jgi:hypothetical protein